MATTIVQKVVLKNTTPEKLYELYMDSKKHSIIAGTPAKISKKVGTPFSAHGDYIKGEKFGPGKKFRHRSNMESAKLE